MPEYVSVPTSPTICGEDGSTDGGDDPDEGTLHLLFQNRHLNSGFLKQVSLF